MTTRIAVCVSTFRRPHGLAKLLAALESMSVPPDVEVRLVIVDNELTDAAATTPEVADWPVTRVVEQERGIPFSRNRAVVEAGDVEAIVFFDDDEQPRVDCLERLVAVWRQSGADVVQGASVPVFEQPPPEWIVRNGYFARDFDHDGEEIPAFMARTSNVLVTRSVFDVSSPPFNPTLRLSGGSDSFLFRTAEDQGFSFVAAPSAIVDEDVPATRVTADWLVQRQYRIGWGRSFHLRRQKPSLIRRAKRVLAGVQSIVLAPRAAWRVRPDPASMRTEMRRSVAYGRGLIMGLVGPAPSEYADIHGR